MADVAAIVLTHQGASFIEETVRQLRASTVPPACVCVVDNASTDDTLARVAEIAGPLDVLARPTNDGYGTAMNEAARRLRLRQPEFLLFLTQECLLAENAIELLLQALRVAPERVAAGPVLRLRSSPSQVWSAGGCLRGRRLSASHRTDVGAPRAVDWLDGAALLVRAEAFYASGGFREDLFLYWEDVDLCRLLAARGGTLVCVPQAQAWQDTSQTPPYLAGRNRIRCLVDRRDWLGTAGALVELVARAARDVLLGRRLTARLLLRGAMDGVCGRLRRDLALLRPV